MECILEILKEFEWVSDAYMVEFFSKSIWQHLPHSWKLFFDEQCSGPEWNRTLCYLIKAEAKPFCVPPLSLLALRKCSTVHSVSRIPETFYSDDAALSPNQKLKLKLKKEHEILRISKLMTQLQKDYGIDRIVDIGSGLGHLSRLLSHSNKLQVTSIEANSDFVKKAAQIDREWERRRATTFNGPEICNRVVEMGGGPALINNIPREKAQAPIALNELLNISDDEKERICITGLHTCGDLGPTIVREFARNPKLSVLVSFGCCYLKLNGGSDKEDLQEYLTLENPGSSAGFPVSVRLKKAGATLSYAARALACHAIEQFSLRLRNPATQTLPRERLLERIRQTNPQAFRTPDQEEPCEFLIHCYRAVLEVLIVAEFPEKWKEGLASVKNAYQLDFKEYCEQTLRKRPDLAERVLSTLDKNQEMIQRYLGMWRQVVAFYCLRLLLAPLVESLILLDRKHFLLEEGIENTHLLPLFDPSISARNIALISLKD